MHTLYTLGYTGAKPVQLQAVVQQLGAVMVDTRYSLASRAVQWTGKGLRELLGESYQHIRALGNVNYKNGGPILINKPEEGVPQVVALLEHQPVILLCVCKDHHTCHRAVVADLVVQACGCAVQHLKSVEISTSQPKGELFPQADYRVNPSPTPSDAAQKVEKTKEIKSTGGYRPSFRSEG
jgi:uncharacterized protein (DUF488 family)